MLDQAEAERKAGVAHMSHRGRAQLIFNMLPKGKIFRELIALEENAPSSKSGEDLLENLEKGFTLEQRRFDCSSRGGRQELHQDQGFVPLPHPPYPLYCLIIWCHGLSLERGAPTWYLARMLMPMEIIK